MVVTVEAYGWYDMCECMSLRLSSNGRAVATPGSAARAVAQDRIIHHECQCEVLCSCRRVGRVSVFLIWVLYMSGDG